MKINLLKICACALLVSALTSTAFAEVRSLPKTEEGLTGTFKVNYPIPMLTKAEARQNASLNIQQVIDKFRYQADKIGNTNVVYKVTAENDAYLSLLFESLAYIPGLAHGEKEAHALVLDKKTGAALPLSHFFNLPDLDFLYKQGHANYIKVLAADGSTEIDARIIQHLKTLPQEYIIDAQGTVYLLANEVTVYATGTPLLMLPQENFPYNYVK